MIGLSLVCVAVTSADGKTFLTKRVAASRHLDLSREVEPVVITGLVDGSWREVVLLGAGAVEGACIVSDAGRRCWAAASRNANPSNVVSVGMYASSPPPPPPSPRAAAAAGCQLHGLKRPRLLNLGHVIICTNAE